MGDRLACLVLVLLAALPVNTARAQDEARYPDWKGQWYRPGGGQGGQWDPSKRAGLAQEPPLTPEYQTIWETGMASTARGGMGHSPTHRCVAAGMPRMMIVFEPMEIVVTPQTTYVRVTYFSESRRIYTDGRDWPATVPLSMRGYSIGKWEDDDGDGRYDTLAVETRGFLGPRYYDGNLPLHADNRSVIKERIALDKSNQNRMVNEVTVIDNALTRPWTVTRSYLRAPQAQPIWIEYICSENNHHIVIGNENYVLSGEGEYLMPTRRDQPPPDLRHFAQPQR
jgi:hypothetical protein